MSFFGGLTTKQKVSMVVAGLVLIACAFFIMLPELWSAIGFPMPSLLGANTGFRWVLGLMVLLLGCILFSALFVPRKRLPMEWSRGH